MDMTWMRRIQQPATPAMIVATAAALGFWFIVDLAVQTDFGLADGTGTRDDSVRFLTALGTLAVGVGVGACALWSFRQPGPAAVIAICLSCTGSAAVITAEVAASEWFEADLPDDSFGPPGFAEMLGLAIVIAAGLHRCPPVAGWAIAGTGGLAIVGSALLRLPDHQYVAVIAALGWGAAVAVGLLLRAATVGREIEIGQTQSDERMELARELHDVVAHDVTGIVVQAQAAQLIVAKDPERVRSMLADIERSGSEALESMRRIVGVLRGTGGAERGPDAGLGGLVDLTERFAATGPPVTFTVDPALSGVVLPVGIAPAVYRVVQESLTNVRKHAPGASAVDVDVTGDAAAVRVRVRNDGAVAAPRGDGFGIVGMTERTRLLGGDLTAGPDGPDGWLVWAVLPLRVGETVR